MTTNETDDWMMELDNDNHQTEEVINSSVNADKRKSQGDASSDDELTPRKRQKVSFWPSKRLPAPQSEEPTPELGELASLKVGVRSPPIEVRVVFKQLREKRLLMGVMDASGERQVKSFGENMRQFDFMQVNRLYRIDKFQVTEGYLGSNDEILLKNTSKVEEISREDFVQIPFNFKGLDVLSKVADNEVLDVIGIVTNIEPSTMSTKGIPKREITITDCSKTEIGVYFWNKDVGVCDDIKLYSPIVFRYATKKSFDNEAVLWVSWKTQVTIDAIHEEAEKLLKWFHEETKAEDMEI